MLQAIQNTAELRSLNKKRIIDYVRFQGKVIKRDISDALGLSFSTTSSLCNQLEDEGFLISKGHAASNGGRMPKVLTFNPASKFILTLNLIRADEVRIALADMAGKRVNEYTVCDITSDDYRQFLRQTCEGVLKMMTEQEIKSDQVLGAAVAIPGIFEHKSGLVKNSTIPLLENKQLAADLKRELGVNVFVENESNLLALASLRLSQTADIDDIIYIYIGEGLGSGIVMNRSLMTGKHGYGSEIGHIPLGNRGYPCYCGKTNCVETELSISGFLVKYREKTGGDSLTGTCIQSQWKQFVKMVKQGDPIAMEVIRENGALIGILAVSIINLLDPDQVYIGGYVDEIFDEMQPFIQDEVDTRLVVDRTAGFQVLCSKGYNRLIVSGCCELALMQWSP